MSIQQQLDDRDGPYFGQWWRHFQQGRTGSTVALLAQQQARGGWQIRPFCPNFLQSAQIWSGGARARPPLYQRRPLCPLDCDRIAPNTWTPKTADSVPTYNPTNLRRVLVQYFDRKNYVPSVTIFRLISTCCVRLKQRRKNRELVHYWQKRNQLDRLVEAIRYERGAII
jgi:hypothetical protein